MKLKQNSLSQSVSWPSLNNIERCIKIICGSKLKELGKEEI